MLIYNPAFDSHHAIFRLLRLLAPAEASAYEIERIRILDFYLLFPATLRLVTFPRSAVRYRRSAAGPANRYERIEDPRRILDRLEPFQISGLRYLAARELIDVSLFAEGRVQRTAVAIPEPLASAVTEANAAESELIQLLVGPFRNVDLYGSSGLKARTQLFEYRYDPTAALASS